MSLLSDIQRRIEDVRSGYLRIESRSQVLGGLAFLFAGILFIVAAEMIGRFGSSVRTLLFGFGVSTIALVSIGFLVRPILKVLRVLPGPSDVELALLIGKVIPAVRDRLLNLLQLSEERSRGTPYSEDLIDASFQDLADTTAGIDFRTALDETPGIRGRVYCFTSAVALALLFIAAPSSSVEAIDRIIRFKEAFQVPAPFLLVVRPGNAEVVKGGSLPVQIRIQTLHAAALPDIPVTVFSRPLGQKRFEPRQIQHDTGDTYSATFSDLRSSMQYYAEFSGSTSNIFDVTVIDRPMLRSFQIRLDYPAYTNRPPRFQDEFVGDISALSGTVVRIGGTASKNLTAGSIHFSDGTRRELNLTGNRFTGRFVIAGSAQYQLHLSDVDGLANADPITYSISALADEHPTVSITEPGKNVDIAGVSTLPLAIQIRDDFGFSKLRLGFRLVHSRYEQPSEHARFTHIPLPPSLSLQGDVPFLWDFSHLKLVPEDVVEYFAEVFDNDRVNGPKAGRSRLFLLRLPSLEEVFTDLDRGHDGAIQELQQAADEARELRKTIQTINEDFKKNKDFDWQQQKDIEEAARTYEELQKKLESVQQNLETMTQQMEEQRVLSSETLEKYLELHQLFEQLDSSELREALQRMQQALQQVNKEQLRQVLQQLSFSEEQFRRSIERTLDLLKRIQIEQKLDEARKRAEELTALQKELADSAKGSGSDSAARALADKQRSLAEKLKKLVETTQALQHRMEEFFTEMPEEELQQALRHLDSMNVRSHMDRASDHLQSGRMDMARQSQSAALQALQQFSQAMSDIQMQMLQEQQHAIMNELRKAIRNLLELSGRQEQLKDRSGSAGVNSPQLRDNAQDQMRVLQDLQNVFAGLEALSRRSFAVTPEMGRALGEAMARMQGALRALETRSGGSASQEQRQAMESLNRAAMAVQQSMQSLSQQGGQGGGLLGQLQGMAGQQLSINMRTQSFGDAARLAAEQEAVRKSLEQLNEEARMTGDHQRILGDLERIAAEMREVVRDLEQGSVNPETLEKQERILSRLLDAARSAREQDFEKKRRAETGKTPALPTPPDLDPLTLEGKNKLHEDLLRALRHGYSKDYQELIRRYFEGLQKAEIR